MQEKVIDAIEPIEARCAWCAADFVLTELTRATAGRCPSCGRLLSPGYTELLLEEVRRVERLQRDFGAALQRLTGLPGGLVVEREAALRATLAELPWPERLAEDDAAAHTEAAALAVAASRRRSDDVAAAALDEALDRTGRQDG